MKSMVVSATWCIMKQRLPHSAYGSSSCKMVAERWVAIQARNESLITGFLRAAQFSFFECQDFFFRGSSAIFCNGVLLAGRLGSTLPSATGWLYQVVSLHPAQVIVSHKSFHLGMHHFFLSRLILLHQTSGRIQTHRHTHSVSLSHSHCFSQCLTTSHHHTLSLSLPHHTHTLSLFLTTHSLCLCLPMILHSV